VIVIDTESVELATPSGPMRTHIVRPAAPGKYPGIVFYTEIFQVTGPIRRTAAMLAGHGYIVAIPEIYHEFEAPGTVRAVLDHLASRPDCTGRLGAMGICIGGHLAFRCAFHPDVLGAVCFYATDIHKGSLSKDGDDSLARAAEIRGELLMAWGRQDPHIPTEGRMKVLTRLNELGLRIGWHEVNGAHAFLRDEGPRYDPELAYSLYGLAFDFFHRKLGLGDLPVQSAAAGETRH
jgi:carboxymethylenebutenolidase